MQEFAGPSQSLFRPTRRLLPLAVSSTTGEEVDFVIESGGRLLPIEIKATSRPRLSDTAGLRSFRSEYGKRARRGLLLHDGELLDWLTPDVLAAPWWRVL